MTIVAIDVRFRNSHCACRASEPRLVDPMFKFAAASRIRHSKPAISL